MDDVVIDQYTIEVDKRMAEPAKKQYCDNCYEKLPFKQINREIIEDSTREIPPYLLDRIVQGDLLSV